jgi:hypothetical protein
MIDVRGAVGKAKDFALDLLAARSVRLEEVELSEEEEGEFWYITLSWVDDPVSGRAYKVFKIKADTGDVVSMKIRAVA